jgi:L-ribulose-5-phosphate 3-epimerase
MISRRGFLHASVAGAVAASLSNRLFAQPQPFLRKAIKFDSVSYGKDLNERFAAIRGAGFEGVEVDSPNKTPRDQILAAAKKNNVIIHGVIDSVHWHQRLSDPVPATRARGLEALKGALQDAKFYGGNTVLLVPGKVSNADGENFDQVWQRSTEEIKKAIPVAEKTGVKIAIEVVWNGFITKPEQLIKYVDQFNSDYVGAYFDCSNMVKFGVPSAQWIRELGKRMLKFDFKGYSNKNGWVKIGEGDENWPDILKALADTNYAGGWATAEVGAGSVAELNDISQRMKQSLGI